MIRLLSTLIEVGDWRLVQKVGKGKEKAEEFSPKQGEFSRKVVDFLFASRCRCRAVGSFNGFWVEARVEIFVVSACGACFFLRSLKKNDVLFRFVFFECLSLWRNSN